MLRTEGRANEYPDTSKFKLFIPWITVPLGQFSAAMLLFAAERPCYITNFQIVLPKNCMTNDFCHIGIVYPRLGTDLVSTDNTYPLFGLPALFTPMTAYDAPYNTNEMVMVTQLLPGSHTGCQKITLPVMKLGGDVNTEGIYLVIERSDETLGGETYASATVTFTVQF